MSTGFCCCCGWGCINLQKHQELKIYHTIVTWNQNTSQFCTYSHLCFPTGWHDVQQNFVSPQADMMCSKTSFPPSFIQVIRRKFSATNDMTMQLVVIMCLNMSLERWTKSKTGLDQDGNSSTSRTAYESRYATCNIANFGVCWVREWPT
jgi:hypothetical protein